jgi:hypothetical protein
MSSAVNTNIITLLLIPPVEESSIRGAWGGFISILYILDKEIDIITWQKPTDVFHPLKGVE